MKAAYLTLGCKVNQYDTDAMRKIMERHGFETVDFNSYADVYIINTCTVTETSDKKSRQMISRAHAKNEDACIVVAGCYSKLNPELVKGLNGVSLVLGTNDRNCIYERVSAFFDGREALSHQTAGFEEISAVPGDRTRAYLKIEDGCDRFCSYCIIPYARGKIESRSLSSVETELKMLKAMGYKEVVLTGIHLMSYGKELRDGTSIENVLQIAANVGIERIRLGSLEPEFCTKSFVQAAYNAKNVCPQFHLALQSGCDTVLQRMNRRYSTNQYRSAVELLREYFEDVAITTDIIAGFSGETEEEHETTVAFAREIGFSKIHVFPYSRRKGTKAYEFENTPSREVKERRTRELIEISNALSLNFREGLLGKKASVLFETGKNGLYRGYSQNYVEVCMYSERDISGTIASVRLVELMDGAILGTCKD